MSYYDGTKLLSLLDKNGKKPEIYICTTNRSGGKTTYFSRWMVNRFLKYGEKFALLYRYSYELDSVDEKFFGDIGHLFFSGMTMGAKKKCSGAFVELYLDKKPCGYAFTLNGADNLKKYSHLLSDTQRIFFDEFQSENGRYCANEIQKFISIHTSIARGRGEQVRHVPVVMCSNAVSLLNPYYSEMGVSTLIRSDAQFIRGDGFVLENGFVESASQLQKASGFNRAFAGNAYVAYSAQNVYLNDNLAFIEKPKGVSRYLGTIRYDGKDYGIREYTQLGLIYCDESADGSCEYKITVDTKDHNKNYLLVSRSDFFIAEMRDYFEHGCFRFKSLKCKEAILQALRY